MKTIDWQRTGGKTQRVTVTEYVEVDQLYAAYHAPINGKANVPESPFAWICGSDGRTSLVYTGSRSFNGYQLPSFGSVST